MQVLPTALQDVVIVEPKVLGDERGFFLEVYNQATFEKLGLPKAFVQDNHSGSQKGVLRGLHYQIQQPQGKLVRALSGAIFDVAVDLRRGSRQFGQWVGVELSAENKRQLWVPPGFAHGFLTLTDFAEVSYKVTQLYAPEHERSLLWNDPAVGVQWPLEGEPILSAKDRAGVPLADGDTYDATDLG
ncbi:MAG TPA: dTDP-4-dehydrorhamnose 3,5-epimerase [Acidobacteriaceae bacterium]|nr:dTDP-4-dehydrorhamnose 3,5-epimerase [Acidobacteriaceae bacterium]